MFIKIKTIYLYQYLYQYILFLINLIKIKILLFILNNLSENHIKYFIPSVNSCLPFCINPKYYYIYNLNSDTEESDNDDINEKLDIYNDYINEIKSVINNIDKNNDIILISNHIDTTKYYYLYYACLFNDFGIVIPKLITNRLKLYSLIFDTLNINDINKNINHDTKYNYLTIFYIKNNKMHYKLIDLINKYDCNTKTELDFGLIYL